MLINFFWKFPLVTSYVLKTMTCKIIVKVCLKRRTYGAWLGIGIEYAPIVSRNILMMLGSIEVEPSYGGSTDRINSSSVGMDWS